MDYLKAFTIGSSGLVVFSFLANIVKNDQYINFENYSLIIPIYYGLMNIIALYIGKQYKLSLQYQLLIVSVISSIIIIFINYKLNKYTKIENEEQNAIFVILQDFIRQLIIFNIIIFYLTENFSKSKVFKIFIIGSSIFSYYINYYFTSRSTQLNYDYKYFAITEPFVQGFFLAMALYIGMNYLKLNLINSNILYNIISSVIMVMIANYLNLYKFDANEYIVKLLMSGFIKIPIYVYLINNLK